MSQTTDTAAALAAINADLASALAKAQGFASQAVNTYNALLKAGCTETERRRAMTDTHGALVSAIQQSQAVLGVLVKRAATEIPKTTKP